MLVRQCTLIIAGLDVQQRAVAVHRGDIGKIVVAREAGCGLLECRFREAIFTALEMDLRFQKFFLGLKCAFRIELRHLLQCGLGFAQTLPAIENARAIEMAIAPREAIGETFGNGQGLLRALQREAVMIESAMRIGHEVERLRLHPMKAVALRELRQRAAECDNRIRAILLRKRVEHALPRLNFEKGIVVALRLYS